MVKANGAMEVAKKEKMEEIEVAQLVRRKASLKERPKLMSGYQFFLRACLKEMKTRYPGSRIDLSVVSKLCADNWKNMSKEIRNRFNDEAVARKKPKSQVGKKVKKPEQVYKKRPFLGFQLFCKERRHELKQCSPDFSKDQIVCKLANMWFSLDPVLKLNYEKLSRKQFKHYHPKDHHAYLSSAKLPEERLTGTSDAEVRDNNEQIKK